LIRSTTFNLVFYSFTFLIALACWVLAKVSDRHAMWRVLNLWGRGVVWLVRWVLGSRIEVRGWQHVDLARPQIFVSKHQSELDIVMLGALMNDISAVAMQELERTPFFGAILRKLDVVMIAVDEGPQGRTQQVIDGALRMKAQGRSMIIFPEGELMKLGARERYRRGAGHIYEAMDVEAVPVAMSLGVIWPQRRWRKFSGVTGALEFMEPILPGMPPEDFMVEVERRIETRTMELIEQHASGERLEAARDRYRRGANNERHLESRGRTSGTV
jgi:1-acyl-sn-glycerol-3-phosphate acyltransferase